MVQLGLYIGRTLVYHTVPWTLEGDCFAIQTHSDKCFWLPNEQKLCFSMGFWKYFVLSLVHKIILPQDGTCSKFGCNLSQSCCDRCMKYKKSLSAALGIGFCNLLSIKACVMAPATASLLVRYSILYINVKSTNVTVILATQACFAFFGNTNPVHDRIAGSCAHKIRKWLITPMSVFLIVWAQVSL